VLKKQGHTIEEFAIAPKGGKSRPQRAAETARPSFEPRERPQIGAYSSETGKRGFVQDCVVAEPVQIEPVSNRNSLLTGKLTGNFAESGPLKAIFANKQPANSVPCREIPYATEQGIFGAITGNFRQRTGNFLSEQQQRLPDMPNQVAATRADGIFESDS
jgi:hypothetical protein